MLVEFQDIQKRFGQKLALDVPSWTMQPGEIVGLVGSNGAGKTTFLRLLLDLLAPDTGEVRIDGTPVNTDGAWRASTGSYLDASFMVDFLTIPEFIEFTGAAYGLGKAEMAARIHPLSNFLPVDSVDRSRLLRDLSTGNAKKVGIAVALAVRPRLLVLDEPFANLDPPSQLRLKEHLLRMSREHGTTMLISSHDLGYVTEICNRITLIRRGAILRDEARSEVTLERLRAYFSDEDAADVT